MATFSDAGIYYFVGDKLNASNICVCLDLPSEPANAVKHVDLTIVLCKAPKYNNVSGGLPLMSCHEPNDSVSIATPISYMEHCLCLKKTSTALKSVHGEV